MVNALVNPTMAPDGSTWPRTGWTKSGAGSAPTVNVVSGVTDIDTVGGRVDIASAAIPVPAGATVAFSGTVQSWSGTFTTELKVLWFTEDYAVDHTQFVTTTSPVNMSWSDVVTNATNAHVQLYWAGSPTYDRGFTFSNFQVTVTEAADVTAPSTPAGLACTGATETTLTYAWSAATDNVAVTGYQLQIVDGATYPTTGLAVEATDLDPGTEYSARVRAGDAAGNWSAWSSAVTGETDAPPPDTEPPSTPAGLECTGATETTLTYAWDAATDNVAVTGYMVQLDGATTYTTAGLSLTVPGLMSGTEYSATVRARDYAGNWSAYSDPVTGTTSSPAPPMLAERVAALLGHPDDAALIAGVAEPVAIVTELARAYTRDVGFIAGEPNSNISAVIVSASARLAANPEQIAHDIGSVSWRGGFAGFSLVEQLTLNRYRKRAL